jgi:hypothetical protein
MALVVGAWVRLQEDVGEAQAMAGGRGDWGPQEWALRETQGKVFESGMARAAA